jgi:hypothetical protein
MYNKDNTFKQIYTSIVDFTNQLQDHVISTQQLNPDEQLYRIYAKYEKSVLMILSRNSKYLDQTLLKV